MKHLGITLLLLAISIAAGFTHLGERDFWPPDEARYGEVSRELREGDHSPLVPHLNGRLYPDKPPGYFLAIHASAELLGEMGEGAARFPSFVGATLLVLLVGLWVARATTAGAGLLAGILLLASVLFSWQMRYAQMDMLVASATGLMMAAFFRTWNGGSVWWCTAGWVALTVGVLVKGPIAPIGLLAVVIWVFATRRPGALFNRGSLVGVLLFAAVTGAGAWYVSGLDQGDEYLRKLVGFHVIERAKSGHAHVKPWWAYARILPTSLLPFSPLLLLGLSRRVRESLMQSSRPLLRFALLWCFVFVVVQSSVPGKRSIYALPVFPAVAIILALLIDGAARARPRVLCGFALLVSSILVMIGLTCVVGGFHADHLNQGIQFADDLSGGKVWPQLARHGVTFDRESDLVAGLFLVGCVVAPLALAGTTIALRGSPRSALGLVGLTFVAAVGAGGGFVAPHLDHVQSRRAVADVIRQLEAERGRPGAVFMFHHLDEGVPFYLARTVPEIPDRFSEELGGERLHKSDESDRRLARTTLVNALLDFDVLVIAREEDLRKFGVIDDFVDHVTARVRVGKRTFLVLAALP
ncbi:MAG: hypothetical protein CMJ83_19140 [Planctomycetes bacterium]|nr:hypothetical protein [Planctomycetota bacterium]